MTVESNDIPDIKKIVKKSKINVNKSIIMGFAVMDFKLIYFKRYKKYVV